MVDAADLPLTEGMYGQSTDFTKNVLSVLYLSPWVGVTGVTAYLITVTLYVSTNKLMNYIWRECNHITVFENCGIYRIFCIIFLLPPHSSRVLAQSWDLVTVCCPYAHVGFLLFLQFPPTSQQHAGEWIVYAKTWKSVWMCVCMVHCDELVSIVSSYTCMRCMTLPLHLWSSKQE